MVRLSCSSAKRMTWGSLALFRFTSSCSRRWSLTDDGRADASSLVRSSQYRASMLARTASSASMAGPRSDLDRASLIFFVGHLTPPGGRGTPSHSAAL